mmetsp:Transcript_9799/g.27747  ORF Transcript_9799/g.27747 Transcript_9799/m.27747 type:complete len:330 (-) Transcript_9799:189-1178(-)
MPDAPLQQLAPRVLILDGRVPALKLHERENGCSQESQLGARGGPRQSVLEGLGHEDQRLKIEGFSTRKAPVHEQPIRKILSDLMKYLDPNHDGHVSSDINAEEVHGPLDLAREHVADLVVEVHEPGGQVFPVAKALPGTEHSAWPSLGVRGPEDVQLPQLAVHVNEPGDTLHHTLLLQGLLQLRPEHGLKLFGQLRQSPPPLLCPRHALQHALRAVHGLQLVSHLTESVSRKARVDFPDESAPVGGFVEGLRAAVEVALEDVQSFERQHVLRRVLLDVSEACAEALHVTGEHIRESLHALRLHHATRQRLQHFSHAPLQLIIQVCRKDL